MSSRNSHHISPDEVLNAPKLASQGEQRLRTIVHGEPNSFTFHIPFEYQHWVLVEFHVKPITSDLAQLPLYAVNGSFTPSHDSINSSQVLTAAQLVDDTYIRVTSLRLTEDFFGRQAPLTSGSSFYSPTSSTLGLEQHIAIGPRSIRAANQQSTHTIPFIKPTLPETHANSQDMIVLGRKTHGTESGGCEPGVISSTGQGQESLDKIVSGLVKAVLSGQRKGRISQIGVIKYHNVITQRLLDCANDQNLNDYLDYLEGALRGRIRIEKHESKIRMWNIRFSLSCLRMVKEQVDNSRKQRSSRAAKIVNDIVNRLLITDGVRAWGAAEQLRDKVAASLDSFQVPFSGFWLHTVTKISYATICDYIGLSNVAELKSVTDTEVLMSVDIPMSWISRQWFDPRDRNLPEPAVSNSDEGVGQNNSVGETLAMETDVDFTADFDHILCEPGIFDPRFAFPT
ncbi:hypothetical protein FOXG_01404 [Fusarium oxysporum f. sp. lycopersici 4287]|uniref:Uncharacterized protein n=1 Tax=Fusarium oxysporum f. sp. lycopersici (strain 4287 / CBS 123668 / FGSC 9935 / NRRL 34936) TaxID=426428 RepID=A0A0J9U9W0_FUSO4|nr:hypothetical protein FOXG_01404 [Fusarium oxysporum f. sp. lycopersici 4287]KNA96058.1 hypothetical protein FOXG_01404 [Fusarium oxysporum f. sp. lycopersici 4287]